MNVQLCQCGCGKSTTVPRTTDRAHGVTAGIPRKFIRGHNANRRRHGMSRTSEHRAYLGARNRCTNPNNHSFHDYGGRGIEFLFASFEEFYAELGVRPNGMSLDRINNNGNYEPGNVRWATKSQQRKNQRPSSLKGRSIVHGGSFKKGHMGYGKGKPLSAEVKRKVSEALKVAWARRKQAA